MEQVDIYDWIERVKELRIAILVRIKKVHLSVCSHLCMKSLQRYRITYQML